MSTGRRLAMQRGFTLLELIVAAGILALIAVFSWRGLDALIREREAIAASQSTIDVLQRSFARIERDALLAGDVQIGEDGSMRLAAGPASTGDASPPTVEYRLLGGALTRSVAGLDSAPQVLVEGVATLVAEAWAPAPGGGAWVRVKGAATEVIRPPVPGAPIKGQPNGSVPASANLAGNATPATAQVNSPLGAQAPVPGMPPAPANPFQATGPNIAAATGLRLSIVRDDGAKIVRSFLVGGG